MNSLKWTLSFFFMSGLLGCAGGPATKKAPEARAVKKPALVTSKQLTVKDDAILASSLLKKSQQASAARNDLLAEWYIDLAIRQKPKNLSLRYQRAQILWRTMRQVEAIEKLDELSKEGFSPARQFLANYFFALGNCEKASQHIDSNSSKRLIEVCLPNQVARSEK